MIEGNIWESDLHFFYHIGKKTGGYIRDELIMGKSQWRQQPSAGRARVELFGMRMAQFSYPFSCRVELSPPRPRPRPHLRPQPREPTARFCPQRAGTIVNKPNENGARAAGLTGPTTGEAKLLFLEWSRATEFRHSFLALVWTEDCSVDNDARVCLGHAIYNPSRESSYGGAPSLNYLKKPFFFIYVCKDSHSFKLKFGSWKSGVKIAQIAVRSLIRC